MIKFLPLLIIGYYSVLPYSLSLISEYGWKYSILTNNFLLEGIPLVALGWNLYVFLIKNINWKLWMLFVLIFTISAVFEARFVCRILHFWIQLYLSTIPQTICIIMSALTIPQNKYCLKFLSTLGKKYAAYIYIFHFIGADTKSLPSVIDNTPYMVWFAFFVALFLSIVYVDFVKPLAKKTLRLMM